MSLNLRSKFEELLEVGIIKNLNFAQNGELEFEFGVPKEKALEFLDNYLFGKYGLIFERVNHVKI
ncbi:hypothetical protein ES705_26944 [subsurface metagenome]